VIVCLDANVVIYLVERNPAWEPKVTARLSILQGAGAALAVSDAARLECLVGPLLSGDAAVLADYTAFFNAPTVSKLPVTAAVWERAAHLRASHRFQAMDSIHLATAIEHGCSLFLTNDAQLSRCTGITVEVLT
jgi:predicted nucleic acid-binding protein